MSDRGNFVFGIHAVQSLLQKQAERIQLLYVQQNRQDDRLTRLLQQAQKAGVAVEYCERRALDDKVRGRHQGVVAAVEAVQEKHEGDLESLVERLDQEGVAPFLLILDSVTDPHNLGACLRSADAAGVHGVIVPRDKSAPLNAAASKVACGAAETVPLFRVTNLARTMKWLQQAGIWISGAAGETDLSIHDASLTGPMALAMGAEGSGLRRLTREHCDQLVRIPMVGSVSSLNVSVATGICLFEALRQRQAAT